MKKIKKYSPFVYFFGGMEGGGEKAPESTDEAPKKETDVTPDNAKEEAKNMTGGALAGLEEAEELSQDPRLKKKLTEDEAIDIYDNMIDPVRKTIDFFKGKESQAKKSQKVRKAVESAFLAADGDPEAMGPGEVVKVSNVLYGGVQERQNDDGCYRYIIDQLNGEDSSNHLNALMQMSRGPHWKRFSKWLDKLHKRRGAAEEAFKKAMA